MSVNSDHALRIREMISAISTGASPSSFGPSYIEALKAGAAALDPKPAITLPAWDIAGRRPTPDTEDESEPPT